MICSFPSPVPPQISPFTFNNESLNTGDSAGVSCIITKGDLPVSIKWTLNASPIPNNNDIGITIVKLSAKTSVLNIASLDGQHRGVFKCIAENSAGVVEYAAELHVNGSYIMFCSHYFNICVFFFPPRHIQTRSSFT